MAADAKGRFVRFGPFELDVRAGELRKHSIKLKLRRAARPDSPHAFGASRRGCPPRRDPAAAVAEQHHRGVPTTASTPPLKSCATPWKNQPASRAISKPWRAVGIGSSVKPKESANSSPSRGSQM